MSEKPLTAIEHLKAGSRGLRGTLAEEVADAATPGLSKDAEQLVKLHGFYQQKDRDLPAAERLPLLMIRGRIPGGRLTADQYLVWDGLADSHGDGTLRLTTRQAVELHGLVKGDAKAVVQALHASLQTSFGACGDVIRNLTQAPNPWLSPELAQLDGVVDRLAARFKLRGRAYAEIWLDGEKVDPATEVEPLHGPTYLPRKFKTAVTVAGENLVDLYTNDLGLAATFDGAGRLDGFHLFAGGGMGMTHGDANTFPRLADHAGWFPESVLVDVAEAVVGVHRDFGDRTNRKRARLKYVLHDRGLAWFRSEILSRTGIALEDRPLPPWRTRRVLGWTHAADGTWTLGFHTLSGRIADTPGRPLRSTLRRLVAELRPGVVLSPDQDLLLTGFSEADKAQAQEVLAAAHLDPESPSQLHDRALACVALPLCGLAITEGERALPGFLADLEKALARRDLLAEAPVFRVTGCANGCARPYAAELALVGRSVGAYSLYAGGSAEGHRLAFEVLPKVALADLSETFRNLVDAWALDRRAGEAFGDWAARLGAEGLALKLGADHA